ncbi:mitochondrial distribution and morphology protein-like protein 31 [Xylogone sp. PMI_703]|nr:mitochondrial distribution and morphology protein-like protein 31 [Xylogone sp. PMI_703]
MTANLKHKIWSRLWGPARSFATTTSWNCQPVTTPQCFTYANTSRRAYHRFSSRWSPFGSNVRIAKSFASGGLLFLDAIPGTTVSNSTNVIPKSSVEKSIVLSHGGIRPSVSCLAKNAWHRHVHSGTRRRVRYASRRNKSSVSNGQGGSKPVKDIKDKYESPKINPKPPQSQHSSESPSSISSMSNKYFPHIPKIPHRPTKEELLAAATGFWSRLKVRFKWFSIRSVRPWNVDDWSAFVSWFVLGNLVWVFIGTTTFFSIIILSINTVFAQETLARWVGDYLTHSAGIKVVFESAIVPKWKDGVISFRNVFISRRPGLGKTKVRKGSSMNAAAEAAAERQADLESGREEEEDTNYTQFDVTIDTVNVTLSFVKWWNGKGLLRDMEVKGIRGVVDRTSVRWSNEYVDPRTYRYEHRPGDFEIDSFKMEDLLLTIHQPNGFRPFSVSIFNCELPQLRKRWLFYDFISANNMSGAIDGSLFTIHPRQIHGVAQTQEQREANGEPNPWKKHSRIRIDGLKIDHLNRGVDGPFGWIYEGNVDIVADIMFPADTDESIVKVMSDFYERMEATVTSNRYLHILENNPRLADLNTPEQKAAFEEKMSRDDDKRYLVMDLRVHLNDVKAAVPLFTRDLSYINQALIRPIVAYINSKRTFIPINCRIVKRASEFDGSWTIFDSGLMQDLSAETYEAFAKDVTDSQARIRRLKKVGFWSISLAIHALFMGMAGNIA